MLEAIIPKVLKIKTVTWEEPEYLRIDTGDEEGPRDCKLLKGASEFLHQTMKFKLSTSKEVNKISQEIWKRLKDLRLQELKEGLNPNDYFALDKKELIYLSDDNYNIIDIFDARNEEAIKEFKDTLDKFVLEITTTQHTNKFFTDSKSGLIKLICYDKDAILPEQNFTPVVIMEMNPEKSSYIAYTGILIYKSFTFIPSLYAYLNCKDLNSFIKSMNILDALDYSKTNAQALYDSYLSFQDNAAEISARELVNLLKKVGYKLNLRENNELADIEGINDEQSNAELKSFFNTFTLTTGETAYDILSLSELKKIFRYNKLTLLDVLKILSKEYLSYDGSKITADLLGSVVYTLYDKDNDKRQVESIKNEVID